MADSPEENRLSGRMRRYARVGTAVGGLCTNGAPLGGVPGELRLGQAVPYSELFVETPATAVAQAEPSHIPI